MSIRTIATPVGVPLRRSRFLRLVLGTVVVVAFGCGGGESAPADGGSLQTADEDWVRTTLSQLDLRGKIGQMIVPWMLADYLAVDGPEYERLMVWVRDYGVGGIVISVGGPLDAASKLNLLQREAAIPLLVASDLEHGPGKRLQGGTVLPYGFDMGGATEFPPPMAIGAADDEELAYEMGRVTALEARAVGVHMAYAPVADVNSNPDNPIINIRSFGADPERVGRLAAAQIRGMQEHGLLATAKHFPGHGDTEVNSHLGLAVLSATRERADSIELVPFRAAVAADVAGVMTAHIAFPGLSGDSLPASLSPRLLSGLLRDELGFAGVVVTDALDMGGITSAEASVQAVLAGADVLLMPSDIEGAIEAIVREVSEGRIPESRIDSSVVRLLRLKSRVGLPETRIVDLDGVAMAVGIPEHREMARRTAERGLTLVRDRDAIVPLASSLRSPRPRIVSVVYSDDIDPWAGRAFQRTLADAVNQLRPNLEPNLETILIDRRTPAGSLDSLATAVAGAELVIVSAFVQVRSWKGEIGLEPGVASFIESVASRQPLALVSFGSPYLIQQAPSVAVYLCAWGEEDVAQEAAARGLVGLTAIDGKLPISIPPLYERGHGVSRQPESR